MNDPVQPGTVQHTYGRNALDQLTADARTGSGSGSTSWGYDSAYHTSTRADSSAGSGDTYAVDAAGQLTGLVTKVGTTTTRSLTLTYNADGARTGQSDSVSGTTATYGYDQADRLVSFASGGTVASYAYDGDGLRAGKTVGGTATAETWDVAEGLPLLLQDGATRYIDGPGGTPIEQVDGVGTVRFYLADYLGSVRGLADASGTITDSYSYDPYGQRTAVTGSATSTPFGYAGQYTDAETGFQYLRARYYDPATGQFLTVDPLVDSTGHPYAYAADNPANNTDPSGQDFCNGSTPIFGHACQAAGAAHNAINDAAKSVLRRAVIGLNDAITSFAQSSFSNGVNDAVIAFALSVQNLPKSVHHLIDDYLRHPEDALALLGQVLLQVLLPLNPLTALQAVQSLAGLLGHLRAEVDCKGLGYTAGYTLTDFILKFALTDAAGGLGKLATEALAEGAALKGGSPCSLCFPAGTLVATPGGEKPIEQLHTGDTVLAEDPTTGTVEAERVAATIVHPASELASVGLSDGSGVTVTADHPFYVDASAVRKQAGWVQAGDLRVGDRLRDASGRDMSVTGVRYNVGRAVVYTLAVGTDHTFFVGTARVLVHNSAPCSVWSRTSAKSPVQNALDHWQKHRAEFPELQNALQYVKFARDFLNSPPATALVKVRPNGDVVIFDPVSDIFGIRTSNGTPKTIFKPNPALHDWPSNLDYYLNT